QELEDVLRDGVSVAGGLYRRRPPLSLDPGRQYQARSLRDFDRVAYQDNVRYGRSPWWSRHRLRLRLERAAYWPGAVAEGTRDLRQVPAATEPGKLQSGPGHATGPRNEDDRSRERIAGVDRT